MVISYDHEHRNARLSLRQKEILEELANDEKLQKAGGAVPGLQHTVWYHPTLHWSLRCSTDENIPTFHPEYGRYMLEATPGKPYGHEIKDFLKVEKDMKRRCSQHTPPITKLIS
jgi:glutamate--cysteine ligase catalytic subunit